MSDYKLQGGGGTDFDAVYNYMELNDTLPDSSMFTDGYLGRVKPDYVIFVIIDKQKESSTICQHITKRHKKRKI